MSAWPSGHQTRVLSKRSRVLVPVGAYFFPFFPLFYILVFLYYIIIHCIMKLFITLHEHVHKSRTSAGKLSLSDSFFPFFFTQLSSCRASVSALFSQLCWRPILAFTALQVLEYSLCNKRVNTLLCIKNVYNDTFQVKLL
jgi:hypothetical protein